MYILLACLSLAVLVYSDDSKHYLLKYPASASIEPAAHPVESKPHDSVGATYQAITKRHYTGAASSSTTAEILNTITSPHSRSSVSFTTTSADHSAEEPPHHPAPPHYPVPTPLHHPSPTPQHHSPLPVEHSPPTHTVYNPTPVPPISHQPTPGHLHSPIYHSTPTPHPTPTYYIGSSPPPSHPLSHPSPPGHPLPQPSPPSHPLSHSYPPSRVLYYSQYPASLAEHPISVPASQHYDLQHIVNDPEHSRTPSTYTYRIPPNQTDDYPPAPRVSPKAFSYQPVITLANNMKSFYKTFNYDPFVVPQPPAPGQYYAGNYLNNLVSEVADIYKSYPASSSYPSSGSYPTHYAPSYPSPDPPIYSTPTPKLIKVFPSPVVSYNVTSAYPSYETSPTPVPILPRVPLSLPPPEGLSLIQGVPKPYKDNAYIEPQRPLFTPVLVFNKYSP